MKVSRHISLRRRLARFPGRDDGAVVVEFGMVMPFMLLVLAVMFESGRMMWSYQVAIAGVRDASRYLARIAPVDICQTGGSLAGYTSTLTDIVREDLSGNNLFPSYVTITSVTPSHSCIAGTYRVNPAPVGTVTASMTIDFPFSGIMAMFGGTMGTTTATISDQARIFGQ